MLRDDHLLQAMAAVGVGGRNVVYVSVPITSGIAEVALLAELGLTSAARLRREQPQRWLHEVRCTNEREALSFAADVRGADWVRRDHVVVDPSRMQVAGWEQDDYNRFWVRLMQEHVRLLVPAPGWEYSRGARLEVGYALSFDPTVLDIVDGLGQPMPRGEVVAVADSARRSLRDRGWTAADVDQYIPELRTLEPQLSPSAQTQAFEWLVDERRHQVEKFGSELDDRRLVAEGLADEGWWSNQMHRYWEAARTHDLAEGAGRVALAKFVATGVAAIESAIRVFGAIPRPRDR